MTSDTDTAEGLAAGGPQAAHLLSFDVEEYFQTEAAREAGVQPDQWPRYESRLAAPMERILELLAGHGASATFFFLGRIAQQHGDLVRRVAAAGHEIASHGMTHTMIDRLTPEAFRAELDDAAHVLEDLSGRPVRGFRALDVLAEAGYAYDSSVCPVRHDRYGVPDAPTSAHVAVGPGGGRLLEIPPATLPLGGRNLAIGGGGWLRLFPVRLLGGRLKRLEADGRAGMIYLHPWEFDPDQPVLPMAPLKRWRHRVGLRRTAGKLRWLLERFRFRSVADQLDTIRSSTTREFTYGRDI